MSQLPIHYQSSAVSSPREPRHIAAHPVSAVEVHRANAPTAAPADGMRGRTSPADSRPLPVAGRATYRFQPRIALHAAAWSTGHTGKSRAARLGRAGKQPPQVASSPLSPSRRSRPHRDGGSSIISRISCSASRERMMSSKSSSASSMISATRARTTCETAGCHELNPASNRSATASIRIGRYSRILSLAIPLL